MCNEAELTRRGQRLEKEEPRLDRENVLLTLHVRTLQRLTVRSVKFTRWLRGGSLSPAVHRRLAPVIRRFVRGILDTVAALAAIIAPNH